MGRTGRHLFGTVIGFTALLALSGCDQFQADPLVITRVDGATIIRMCLDVTVEGIVADRADDDLESRDILWSATGSAHVLAGDEFALSSLPAGLTASSTFDETVLDREDVSLRLQVRSDDGHGEWETFTPLDAGAVTEHTWLDGWGEPTESPCILPPCSPWAACNNNWPQPSGYPTDLEPTYVPTPAPTPISP